MGVNLLGCFPMDAKRRVEVDFVLEFRPLTRLLPAEKCDFSLNGLQIS